MSDFRIIEGNCLDTLATLPEQSVQTCVTSPPYWGLRDYGTATWIGGDIADCAHVHSNARRDHSREQMLGTRGKQSSAAAAATPMRAVCSRCGATRVDEQIGLESTPEEYVANMVEVFRGVRRVLRDDGTLWLNLGDSYAARASGRDERGRDAIDRPLEHRQPQIGPRHAGRPAGLKDKDLVGIPWMVAFALRADGWYLRSEIIWHKPAPMPESVRDRPTKAHEQIFLLSKQRRYFYDSDAIREPASHLGPNGRASSPYAQGFAQRTDEQEAERRERVTAKRTVRPGVDTNGGGQGSGEMTYPLLSRNKRSVWTVATQPFPGAHFATFPPKLIEPCILAGSSEGDTVLDPFAGAGTTGLVALRHNRNFIGCELNPEYAAMATERIREDAPLLNFEVAA